MTAELGPIELVGLKDALKILNSTDKSLRRQITKDYKQIVAPVLREAAQRLPDEAPLSGMARSWKPKGAELMNWKPKLVEKNLKAFTSGKKVRDAPGGFKQNLGVFGIRWGGPQATLFDMARKGQWSDSMTARYGPPSRVIWKAYEAQAREVQEQVEQLARRVIEEANRRIGNY